MARELEMLGGVGEISDAELVCRLEQLVKADRVLSAKLLVHLGELDARGLYRERGFSSMFEYCRTALRMSEAEAYLRILAARLGRRIPLVVERFGAGELNLTAIKLLASHLNDENCVQLLERARGKTKREIEVLVAELAPKPDVPARMRKLPEARGSRSAVSSAPLLAFAQDTQAPRSVRASDLRQDRAGEPAEPAPVRASSTPLSPGRFKLEVTLGQEAHDKLEQLRELLRYQNPSGDFALIVERALGELHERTMTRRFAHLMRKRVTATAAAPSAACVDARLESGGLFSESASTDMKAAASVTCDAAALPANAAMQRKLDGPLSDARAKKVSSPKSRYIPRQVLREVYARDQGRCSFVSPDGRRCTARGFLEIHHHETTFARGGEASVANLRLACRSHNALLAERDYGRSFMQDKLRAAAVQRTLAEISPNKFQNEFQL